MFHNRAVLRACGRTIHALVTAGQSHAALVACRTAQPESLHVIHVIAVISTQAGKRDEVLSAFEQVVPIVHTEHGCREYQPVTDIVGASSSAATLGPDSYMVIEKWDSIEDLRAHAASSHMSEFQRQVGDLIVDRKVYVLD